MPDQFGTPVKIPGPDPIPADKLPSPRLGETLTDAARRDVEQIQENLRHAERRIGSFLLR
ncbi:hypothetical protein NLM16_08995 [Bradyrhizobium brasilense]|uniref:hypothetical protein n=1 Tax=Bradyrhizobium brasilense TaxID=1419277 RepID=UPI00287750FE|nr:hypothetical protein [Bradyrhizobium brasilense]MCP3414235.1 hypothetical protein [Bradyrhizobium brasilense]